MALRVEIRFRAYERAWRSRGRAPFGDHSLHKDCGYHPRYKRRMSAREAPPLTTATTETTRLTSDPIPPDELRADVTCLFEAMAAGGIGIVPLDVAYAMVATTPGGIRRIFELKRRSYELHSNVGRRTLLQGLVVFAQTLKFIFEIFVRHAWTSLCNALPLGNTPFVPYHATIQSPLPRAITRRFGCRRGNKDQRFSGSEL